MAIYHCRFKVHSRGRGATAARSAAYRSGSKVEEKGPMPVRAEAARTTSAVRAAAYRAGGVLTDLDGEVHDFTRKSGIVWTGILLPENAPEWAGRRSDLWRAVEAGEKRKDAQLFREVEISIPRELDPLARRGLVQAFVKDQFVDKGMVADVAIHCPKASDGGEQPHAHVMLTMRTIGPDGFGKKQRDWNDRAFLQKAREAWERYCNAALEKAGSGERIDHRSLKNQGRDQAPVGHLGRAVHVKTPTVGLSAKHRHFLDTHFMGRARAMSVAIGRHFQAPSASAYTADMPDDFIEQVRRMGAGIGTVARQGGYRYARDGVEHAERTARALRGDAPSHAHERDDGWGL